MTTLDRSSKNRLNVRLLSQFPGDTLFDAIARNGGTPSSEFIKRID
jgi:hypothetical protein